MTTFDTREKAFEDKFVYDANLKFLADARRDKRVAAWAAGQMGLSGQLAADYAKSLRNPSGAALDIFAKLKADLHAHAIVISDAELQATIAGFERQAWQEVASGL